MFLSVSDLHNAVSNKRRLCGVTAQTRARAFSGGDIKPIRAKVPICCQTLFSGLLGSGREARWPNG